MGYLAALIWTAASAALARWRPAGFLAVFLLATTTVLHGGWLGFGVLAALGGTIVAMGRLATNARSEAARRLVLSPVTLGLGTLLAGVWVSFVVNRGETSAGELTAMLRDAKGISLAFAVYVAGFGLATGFRRVRVAIWALLATGAVLGLLRVGQMVGVNLAALLSDHLGTTLLGDLEPSAQQNSYGAFQALVLALALYVLVRPGWRLAAVGALVAAFQWLLLTSYSRTAMVAYASVLVATFWLADRRQRRVVLATGVAFLVLAVTIQWQKPVLTAQRSIPPGAVEESLPAAARRARQERELAYWTSPLTSPRFAAVQRIRVPERLLPSNVVRMFVRHSTWDVPGTLDVEVEDTLVQRMTPKAPEDWNGSFFWKEAPVPRALLEGKRWINVTLRVTGLTDARLNFVEVAGVNVLADGLRSELFNGYANMSWDLSSRQGRQLGTFLIFLNEDWPERIERTIPTSGLALDNSIVERVVWARVALANYAAHPAVGSGFGSLVFQAPRYIGAAPVFVEFANAHSNYFQILSECGILGLGGWLVLVLAPVGLIVVRRWRRRSSAIGASFDLAFGGFFLVWALTSVMQYTITDTRLFHVWLFYLGIWAAQFHRGRYGLVRWPGARTLGGSTEPSAIGGSAAARWRASGTPGGERPPGRAPVSR